MRKLFISGIVAFALFMATLPALASTPNDEASYGQSCSSSGEAGGWIDPNGRSDGSSGETGGSMDPDG